MSRMSHKEWSELTAAAKRLKSLRVVGPWTHKNDGTQWGSWVRVYEQALVAVVREAKDEVPDLTGGGYVNLELASDGSMAGSFPVRCKADADDVLVRLGLTLVDDAVSSASAP
jgi:hypothetical protein